MNKLKRINVDKVREMFKRAGFKPIQCDPKRCLMAAAVYPLELSIDNIKKAGFDLSYACGCIEGFDEEEYATVNYLEIDKNSLEYKLGYADGTCCRKTMFGK